MNPDLSTYDNSWYNPGGNSVKRLCWYFANLLFIIKRWNPVSKLKIIILKAFGAKIGNGVVVKPGVNIKYPWLLTIGDNTWIGEDVWIDNLAQVTIGSNCCISQGAMLLCGNHNYKRSTFDLIVKPIVIEDGAWIGAMSTVCPGVTIGSQSLLSVGSIATSNLIPNKIYQGIPAKIKSERIIQ